MTSLSRNEIQNAIFDFIQASVGTLVPQNKVVWREQSAALPARPAIGLKIISGPDEVGSFDDVMDAGDDTNVNVGGHRTYSISIQVFGNGDVGSSNAYQIATNIHSSLKRPTILEGLRRSGLSVHEIGTVQDISFLEESEYEERAQLDILIGVASNVEDQPSFIETVDPIVRVDP